MIDLKEKSKRNVWKIKKEYMIKSLKFGKNKSETLFNAIKSQKIILLKIDK